MSLSSSALYLKRESVSFAFQLRRDPEKPVSSEFNNKAWKRMPLGTKLTCNDVDKLDFNNTANVEDKWYINKNLDLAYFSTLASDSVPSDTSTDVESDSLSATDALASLYTPVRSPFMVHEKTSDMLGVFFEVPAKHSSDSWEFRGWSRVPIILSL